MLKFHRPIIAVIGCGGTGSYFVSHLGRLLGAYGELRSINPQAVLLIDADVVSESNTKRQNFAYREIGLQKGLVLANRLQQSHQVQNIDFWASYLNTKLIAKLMAKAERHPLILVMCVDNHATRNRMMSVLKPDPDSFEGARQKDWLYLDAGNSTYEGWTSCMGVYNGQGVGIDMRMMDSAIRNNTGQNAPTLDGSGREQRGCGAASSSPETFFGNQNNSYLLGSQLRSILLFGKGYGITGWQRPNLESESWMTESYQNHFLAPFELP